MAEKMQQSHIEAEGGGGSTPSLGKTQAELEQKNKVSKKNSVSSRRPSTPAKVNSPTSTSIKHPLPELCPDIKKPEENDNRLILAAKDETKRIESIKSDLISYYSGEEHTE